MNDKETRHVFDNPKNVKRVIYALFAASALAFLADFFIHRHVAHPWEALFGFHALYGFGACVVLVVIAKELRKIVMRKETYYVDE